MEMLVTVQELFQTAVGCTQPGRWISEWGKAWLHYTHVAKALVMHWLSPCTHTLYTMLPL